MTEEVFYVYRTGYKAAGFYVRDTLKSVCEYIHAINQERIEHKVSLIKSELSRKEIINVTAKAENIYDMYHQRNELFP